MKLLGSAVSVLVVLAFALIGVSYGDQGQVTIKRDNYGVGHVYADTVYGLFYGYGYAVAQDRLFQMEMAKRITQGKVAEVLGEEYVEFDKRIRGNYNPISIQRQLDRLSESDADIFNGYAAGVNAWIEEVKKNADRLIPKELRSKMGNLWSSLLIGPYTARSSSWTKKTVLPIPRSVPGMAWNWSPCWAGSTPHGPKILMNGYPKPSEWP